MKHNVSYFCVLQFTSFSRSNKLRTDKIKIKTDIVRKLVRNASTELPAQMHTCLLKWTKGENRHSAPILCAMEANESQKYSQQQENVFKTGNKQECY